MKRKPFPNSTFNTESLSPTRLFEREFIGTPGSSRSHHVYDTCACCEKRDCEALEEYNKTIKKLEGDTRLAAEIGQSLLIKHEDYVTESSQRTAKLTQQLEECNQKIRALEQSLDQAETSKEELMAEKKQWLRKQQKKQKTLDNTLSDLEFTGERCQQLTGELQSKNNELEKLRVFKFMVRQSEAREETLSTKLEDTYQELAICRKNELLLESKIKKLKMKYESLYNSHHTPTKMTPQPSDDSHSLTTYIHDISSTNNRLKSDIINYQEQLSDARQEIDSLQQKIQRKSPKNSLQKEKKRAESIHCKESGRPTTRSRAALPPLPTVSSSMPTTGAGSPVVHHHYHYYMKNKGEPAEEEEEEVDSLTENVPERSQSPEEIKYPFVFLQDQIRQILNRFQDTNLIVLNRRLKRTFDIVEISRMSNAVIENIMGDIGALETHFLWLREEDDPHLFSFFSFLQALKDALQELGSLKQTINELQMAYVQKVEENELRVEEEIVQKRIHKRKARATPSSSPLSWLTTVFYRSSNNTVHFLDEDEHTLVRSSHPKEDPLRSHRRNYRQQKLSPALPIVRSKRSFHRLDEPAPIRSMIVASSDNVNSSSSDIPSVTLSSSWLGGK